MNIKVLALIEGARAKERMITGKAQDPVENSPHGKTREIVAAQLGTSATQLRNEQFIADNADMLDPADRSAVIDYMYENQTGRRNLTPGQKSTLELDVSEAKLREEARLKLVEAGKKQGGDRRSTSYREAKSASNQLVGSRSEQEPQSESADDSDSDPQVAKVATSPPDKKRENETAYRLAKRAGVGVGTMKRTMEVKKSGDQELYTRTA